MPYFSTKKLEKILSFETQLILYKTTHRHNQQESAAALEEGATGELTMDKLNTLNPVVTICTTCFITPKLYILQTDCSCA
jgi:hypothetical protein